MPSPAIVAQPAFIIARQARELIELREMVQTTVASLDRVTQERDAARSDCATQRLQVSNT